MPLAKRMRPSLTAGSTRRTDQADAGEQWAYANAEDTPMAQRGLTKRNDELDDST